ncbi:hypothetical protein SPSYN_01521 [Sporotomaculum syntrophicum]|uniref:Uncharacterized protein n=1 Tax=Sporotomaculum syntrophicum TaxID=182264 RepID=A0A9D2WQR0_9FIRM|nr:hypothetical protein [Sporotomaculum syntrophicum]KAF1085385.1 hypothetical protein SPSYN_01521 [Sporotomaculum syntrophicum]
MSKTFMPMLLISVAAMGTYYLLATEAGLSESLSMAGGIAIGLLGAVVTTKLLRGKG